MRTKWLLLIVVTVAAVSACRPHPNGVTRDNPGVVEKKLTIHYNVHTKKITGVNDPASTKDAKEYPLPATCDPSHWSLPNCIPIIPPGDGGPIGGSMHPITREDTIHIISDFASPGCVCYGQWCVCD